MYSTTHIAGIKWFIYSKNIYNFLNSFLHYLANTIKVLCCLFFCMMDGNVLSSLAFCFCMSLNTDIESRHLIASIELLCKNVFIKIAFINLSFHHLLQMNSEVIKNDRCQRQEEKTKKTQRKQILIILNWSFYIFRWTLTKHCFSFRSKL